MISYFSSQSMDIPCNVRLYKAWTEHTIQQRKMNKNVLKSDACCHEKCSLLFSLFFPRLVAVAIVHRTQEMISYIICKHDLMYNYGGWYKKLAATKLFN